MRFPRNARVFKTRLDVAPYAIVFFLLVMFMMLGSLVYTPGVKLELPRADGLPGTDQQTVAVGLDANGRYYYQNQGIEERALSVQLHQKCKQSSEPLTLLIYADKRASYDMLLHLMMIARQAGITNALGAALPRPFDSDSRL